MKCAKKLKVGHIFLNAYVTAVIIWLFFPLKKNRTREKMRKSAREKKNGLEKYVNPSKSVREKENMPVKIFVKFHP